LAGVAATPDEQPFRVPAQPLGLRSGIDPARLNALNDDLAVDAFLEVAQQDPEAASAPHNSHETQRQGRSAP
jgi:hypothetical protein